MPRKRAEQPVMPKAAELLREGVWTVPQVAVLLDTPERLIEHWCSVSLIPGAAHRDGSWRIPGRGLFFFTSRCVERHYSPETVAALLDVEVSTVRSWIKHKRLRKSKWGAAKSAPVRITESELMRFLGGHS